MDSQRYGLNVRVLPLPNSSGKSRKQGKLPAKKSSSGPSYKGTIKEQLVRKHVGSRLTDTGPKSLYPALGDERMRKKKKKKSGSGSDSDSDLDLTKPVFPIGHYLKEREKMVEQVFRAVHGQKLRAMLPQILQKIPMAELKKLCLEHLQIMSKKRIQHILEGHTEEEISSSGTEEEEEECEFSSGEESKVLLGEKGLKSIKMEVPDETSAAPDSTSHQDEELGLAIQETPVVQSGISQRGPLQLKKRHRKRKKQQLLEQNSAISSSSAGLSPLQNASSLQQASADSAVEAVTPLPNVTQVAVLSGDKVRIVRAAFVKQQLAGPSSAQAAVPDADIIEGMVEAGHDAGDEGRSFTPCSETDSASSTSSDTDDDSAVSASDVEMEAAEKIPNGPARAEPASSLKQKEVLTTSKKEPMPSCSGLSVSRSKTSTIAGTSGSLQLEEGELSEGVEGMSIEALSDREDPATLEEDDSEGSDVDGDEVADKSMADVTMSAPVRNAKPAVDSPTRVQQPQGNVSSRTVLPKKTEVVPTTQKSSAPTTQKPLVPTASVSTGQAVERKTLSASNPPKADPVVDVKTSAQPEAIEGRTVKKARTVKLEHLAELTPDVGPSEAKTQKVSDSATTGLEAPRQKVSNIRQRLGAKLPATDSKKAKTSEGVKGEGAALQKTVSKRKVKRKGAQHREKKVPDGREGKTTLEILELEMRARAIKAMLQKFQTTSD